MTLCSAVFGEQYMKEVLVTPYFSCFHLKFSITFIWEKTLRKILKVLISVLIFRVKFQIFFSFSLLSYHQCFQQTEIATTISHSLPIFLIFTFCKATLINPTFTNKSLTNDDTGFKNTCSFPLCW